MSIGGFANKVAWINLSDGSVAYKGVDEEDARKYIGARGLGVKYVFDNGPDVDPFSADNILCVMGGPLTGTDVNMSGRLAVVTKSPLTGTVTDSHMGGWTAAKLKWAGFDGLVFKGKSDKPVYAYVEDGQVTLNDASDLWGKGVHETLKTLRERHGEACDGMAIGQAGENPVKFPCWMEPKLDGYRFMIEFDPGGAYRVVQRSGVDYTDRLGFIADQLAPEITARFSNGCCIDGEILAGNSWGLTTTLVKTEKKIDRSRLIFYSFDLIEGGSQQIIDMSPLHRRKARLADLIEKVDGLNVSMAIHVECSNVEDIKRHFTTFVETGFEGGMIKDPNGRYEARRSRAWLKYKPWTSTDGRIVGFDEGKGRLVGSLGALKLKMPDGSEVEVGGGFKDAERKDIWDNRDAYLGRWVEFKHQDDSTKVASYRFTGFLRFRPDMDEASD